VTGSLTATISNGIMTFSVMQKASNIGIGDRVTYDTNKECYLISKISQNKAVWSVVDNLGDSVGDTTNVSVNSITHCFDSLSAAEAGMSNIIGSKDLVTLNVRLWIPCYNDTGPDIQSVSFTGWDTSTQAAIVVYAPILTDTECNNRQQHRGLPDQGYRLIVDNVGYILDIDGPNIVIEGIEVGGDSIEGIHIHGSTEIGFSHNARVKNCIVHNVGGNDGYGICFLEDAIGTIANASCWNNIVYGIEGIGIHFNTSGNCFIYNNTIYGNTIGTKIGSVFTSDIADSTFFGNGRDVEGTLSSRSVNQNNCAEDSDFLSRTNSLNNFLITQSADDYAALVQDAPNGNFFITDVNSEMYQTGSWDLTPRSPFTSSPNGEISSPDMAGHYRGQSGDEVIDIGALVFFECPLLFQDLENLADNKQLNSTLKSLGDNILNVLKGNQETVQIEIKIDYDINATRKVADLDVECPETHTLKRSIKNIRRKI